MLNHGTGKECIRFYKSLAEMITDKRKMPISKFFFDIFTHFKQKNTITRYVNINVPGIQVKKRLKKEC